MPVMPTTGAQRYAGIPKGGGRGGRIFFRGKWPLLTKDMLVNGLSAKKNVLRNRCGITDSDATNSRHTLLLRNSCELNSKSGGS
jgi:hypothetical protein